MPATLPAPRPGLLDRATVFLDIDGTLLELADDPEAVRADGQTRALLRDLAERLDGRLAMVSGRSLEQIDRILGPIAQALPVTGSHGLEYRWNEVWARPERLAVLNDVASAFHSLAQTWPGCLVEEKSYGVAFHWRLAPQARQQAETMAVQLADSHALKIQHGKDLVELRMPGGDKGQAVRRLMARKGMIGTRPVFFGDDLTDEAGFAAARALGGHGVLVGERALNGSSTAATLALPSPHAVRAFLRAFADGTAQVPE
ncbi:MULTISPECIES: trehalose-phosphatase [unclassified Novosphingobium]|uniref:trehalose-phosphatase n=1 Tax=unclassified Novosphingobium TaxID=2644732 RepID=UPI00144170EB|nr:MULTISPECIES: trehalose-phosphatase [unclassified Novosphingobium]MBB3358989.1 trehalose 6-phosphate phosphatase [Novosphingobium sp. BK256]MBB3375530.1 trehalose 6-phosphate phosphatase [Novosphingobium sp. BK280]MBB3379761.1 trehalose 6-phosphate phosphatase [Novosphingobium sp. BK258]MBB3421456.1 trehalose 6-phosphate phosphatase [Novosphingobium sp. BK267]MBB3449771.1 trehalose 6-phosphate phosphatase [Novosphingobium sp. BK352]